MEKDLTITFKIAIQQCTGAFYEMAARYHLENDASDMVLGESCKDLCKYLRTRQVMEGIRPLTGDMAIFDEYQTGRKIL